MRAVTVKSIQDAWAFIPTKLPTARRSIQERHPGTRSQVRELARSEVSSLRDRVMAAAQHPDADRELRKLAGTLVPRQLRAVVRSIGTWEDLRKEIRVVAEARPKATYVPALWQAWQEHPQPRQVLSLLVAMGERFGMVDALGERYATEGARWLEEEKPIDAIVRWTASQEIGWEDLAELPASPFNADTPLIQRVFHRTLQIGSGQQLLRMPEEVVLDGWSEMSGVGLKEACTNYLERIDPSLWAANGNALDTIRKTYGLPGARGSRSDFWKQVSEQRRGDFREYFITQALRRAFRGDSARHRFWMGLRREMLDVSHGYAGDSAWSLIDFPGYSVLEFFKVGNAAYLYPEGEPTLKRIRRRDSFSSPSEIKNILTRPVPGRSDNRIIHRARWQSKARSTLKAWKTQYS